MWEQGAGGGACDRACAREIMNKLREVAAGTILLFTASLSPATSIASIKLEELYLRSKMVAIVHLVSGDEEHYQYSQTDSQFWPVCKAKVLKGFKGAQAGQTIYLSPCSGMEISSDYMLFLDDIAPPYLPIGREQGSYGPINKAERWADAGYGMMLIEYACIFDGQMSDRACDYGVRLNPEQIVLPKALVAFPKSKATAETNYRRWVRRDDLVEILNALELKAKP